MPTIMHISDLHRKARHGPTNLDIVTTLIEDVTKGFERDNRALGLDGTPEALSWPDVLIVSGDLCWNAEPEQYSAAPNNTDDVDVEGLLTQLCDAFVGGDRGRVVLVPGNHDVHWPTFQNDPSAIVEVPPDDHAEDVIEGRRNDSTVRYRKGDRYRERLRNCSSFLDAWYWPVTSGLASGFPLDHGFRVFEYDALNLIVVGFSSVEDNDSYSTEGRLNDSDIWRAKREIERFRTQKPEALCVAVCHHGQMPSESGHGRDRVTADQFRALGRAGFQIVLHGHSHRTEFERLPSLLDGNGPLVLGAGTIGAPPIDRPESVGFAYNVISFTSNREVVVHARERPTRLAGWRPTLWLTGGSMPRWVSAVTVSVS